MAKTKKQDGEQEVSPGYERWKVQIHQKEEGNSFEKLKLDKKCVKISDEEAETLNSGVLNGGSKYAMMYFKPEIQ